MSKTLYAYYRARELRFIRRLAQDFARHARPPRAGSCSSRTASGRPARRTADRVVRPPGRRVHQKLEDEFPELTDALLNTLYPHYLAPTPSMAIVQFELDAGQARFARRIHDREGEPPRDPARGRAPVQVSTGYPVTLWPVRLTEARLAPPPFPVGLEIPPPGPPRPCDCGWIAWPASGSPT